MGESIHDKLSRVRKAHVHITIAKQDAGLPATELPFVVGVLGNFSVDSEKDPLEEGRFVEVTRDNFGDFMASVQPAANVRVRNMLAKEGDKETELQVGLTFPSIEDTEPAGIVKQVPALQQLLEARKLLLQLGSVVDRSRGGERILEDILQSPDKLQRLKEEVGRSQAAPEE
jgi:type VI secretion system protein ImpB